MSNHTERGANSGTQVLQRAAALLRLITANNRLGMRLTDLHASSAIEKPTAHRILQGLIAEQMVRQDNANKRYYLGPAMYEMGLVAAPRVALRDICLPHLQAIAEQTGDTVFLTIRSGFDGLCIDRAEGGFPIKAFVLDIGRRRPLNVGGGSLAILSTLPEAEIQRICSANADRVKANFPRYNTADLLRDIAASRARGYALKDVLEIPEVRSVAVPICRQDGEAIAAISVATLKARLDDARAATVAGCIAQAVAQIEKRLGDGHP
ncbi:MULTISPECIES: IclR family transcriptional regulator [Achromobacter]|uniref:HTH-type transcriptional regulator KipR n=1 Tax=Achromobacter agilis TaxID=1353888 RepID=A0A446CMK3_9BURK|nr:MULTISPECIES: IclR family transcriptional regulator [Achromobacter]KGD93464.1 IclR family transcriptional regulator [Achromobacter sp. RTa]SSW69011.1 HTH-type transcriptional regulator KipR [Achromobacter agilis]